MADYKGGTATTCLWRIRYPIFTPVILLSVTPYWNCRGPIIFCFTDGLDGFYGCRMFYWVHASEMTLFSPFSQIFLWLHPSTSNDPVQAANLLLSTFHGLPLE